MDVKEGKNLNKKDVDLSIVIPVKDEEGNVSFLSEEITKVMNNTTFSWECIWVDDGSTDNTLSELKRINGEDQRHQFVILSKNYGQSAALSVGFRYARGKIITTMDGDGQNDPGDIPILVNRLLDSKLDMVNGWRKGRKDSLVKKISSRIANGFRNWVTRDQVRDVGCSLRVFRHQCVEHVPVFNGMHRFLPTLVRMNGFSKIIEVPVKHRPRNYGQTKYGIQNRLWVGLIDTLAVKWMQSRMVYPEVESSSFRIKEFI